MRMRKKCVFLAKRCNQHDTPPDSQSQFTNKISHENRMGRFWEISFAN